MKRATVGERFWAKVDKNGAIPVAHPELGACWLWIAALRGGYGRFRVNGRKEEAHRVAYVLVRGGIPEGYQVDHLCHNGDPSCNGGDKDPCLHRRCVNPEHLEAVSGLVNVHRSNGVAAKNAARTTCPRGHVYDVVTKSGERRCRRCITVGLHQSQARKRAAQSKEYR